MRPDEILTEVRLPTVEDRSGWAFEELALRENHVAIVEVAAQLTVDQGGSCMAARLAVGGCVIKRLGCALSKKFWRQVLATVFCAKRRSAPPSWSIQSTTSMPRAPTAGA